MQGITIYMAANQASHCDIKGRDVMATSRIFDRHPVFPSIASDANSCIAKPLSNRPPSPSVSSYGHVHAPSCIIHATFPIFRAPIPDTCPALYISAPLSCPPNIRRLSPRARYSLPPRHIIITTKAPALRGLLSHLPRSYMPLDRPP
jgi:hypothetical protein